MRSRVLNSIGREYTEKTFKGCHELVVEDDNVFLSPRALPRRLSVRDHTKTVRDLQISKLLGSGGFGNVYLATMDEKVVAVKRMHGCTRKNKKARLESFIAELNVLNLSHPNLVKTLASTPRDNPENVYIIMEYAGDRNLQHVLNNPMYPLDIEHRLRHMLQMVNALEYLHSHNVVHLDFKPANIMVSTSGTCKLCDFGCSQVVVDDKGVISPTKRSYLTGTFAYRAPELLRGEAPRTRADIYSLGITLWQMMTRTFPYGTEDQHVVIFAVVAYNLRPKMPQDEELHPAEQLYRDLFIQCWQPKVEDRPTAKTLQDVVQTMMDNL